MHYKEIVKDQNIRNLFLLLIKSGGIIYGGAVGDLFRNEEYSPIDFDVYYSHKSLLAENVFKHKHGKLINSVAVDEFIGQMAGLGKHIVWDSVSDYECYNEENNVRIINLLPNLTATIHLVSSAEIYCDNLPTEDLSFLDFDVNSLYIDSNGEFQSTLGKDKFKSIIDSIKNNRCKLMRSDVDSYRIEYFLKKGFDCDSLAFL